MFFQHLQPEAMDLLAELVEHGHSRAIKKLGIPALYRENWDTLK